MRDVPAGVLTLKRRLVERKKFPEKKIERRFASMLELVYAATDRFPPECMDFQTRPCMSLIVPQNGIGKSFGDTSVLALAAHVWTNHGEDHW